MGAYRSKPITEKVSEGGEYHSGSMKIVYGVSSMQGWRMFMEDAHCVIPHFDDNSSLFGVYDGHGGREVAVYCAMHLADIIKSTEAYRQGSVEQAMKDAFMQCDRLTTEENAIEEMRKYDEDEMSNEENELESEGELESLLEESSLPLHNLLTRYNVPELDDSGPVEKDNSDLKRQGISTILQLLTRNPDVDFDDSDSDSEEDSDKDETEIREENQSDCSTLTQKVLTSVSELKNTVSVASNSTPHDQSNRTKIDYSDTIQSSSITLNSSSTSNSGSLKRHDNDNSTVDIVKRKSSADKLEPRSLMDLLTSKPSGKSVVSSKVITSRKRPHQDDNYNSSKKSASKVDKQGYHSGTTAVVGILREKEFIVANAGDSKCVMSCRGKAVDMSFDHKPTDQRELDRITNAGGHVGTDNRVNGGLNLSRAIGDHFYKKNNSLSLEDQMISAMPDIKSVSVTGDDEFIIFACDGIWNSMSSQEVVDFVCSRLRSEVPTQQNLCLVCEELCDACLATGTDNDGTGCDNMTCILIFLQT